MNLTRRTVLASAGALAAFAGVSGCSGSNNDDPDAPITIALGGSANNYIPDPDNVISQEIKKATEVNVVAGAMPEDIAASLAAGDSPDVFRVTRNQLNAFVDQGLVLDLSPYEDQLGTYVDFVGQEAADRGRVDQKLSAIARYPNDVNGLTYWIRQDWLDKLDLEIPSTVEEFAEVLTAFTQEDPDQNGKGDTFGLTGASPDQTFRPLWGSFGTPGPGTIYVDDARQVRSGYDDDGITEAISYIAGLHTAKLIDPDSYSVSASEARDRGFQGTAGVLAQAWTEVKKTQAVELSKAANPDAEWVQLDLFPQQDGSPSSIPVAADAVFFALPATLAGNDATIEKIITYINYIASPEGQMLVQYGVEGTHYELEDDGTVTPLPAMDEEGGYFFVFQMLGREETPYLETKFPKQKKYFKRAQDQPTVTNYASFITTPEGYSQSDTERYAAEQMVGFLTGRTPVSEYPAFVEALYGKFGYQKFVDAATTQLTELGIAG